MTGIRSARIWHIPTLLGILWPHTRALGKTGRSWGTDIWLVFLAVLRGWVRYFRDSHGMAGFIIRDQERIYALYVRQHAQGEGIGSRLLNEAKSQCSWLELWTLQSNHLARDFYHAHGFVESDRGYGLGNDLNLPDIHLIWSKETTV